MDKIYMVRAYFENYDSSMWRIIGIFDNKRVADEIANKWVYFYQDKKLMFSQPVDWDTENYGDWQESDEFYTLISKFTEIHEFREIEVEEFDMNKELSLEKDLIIGKDLLNMMKQWDRGYKLNKLTD